MAIAVNMRMEWSRMQKYHLLNPPTESKQNIYIYISSPKTNTLIELYPRLITYYENKRLYANLWGFHWVMLRKVNLKLISFICIKSSLSSIDFNNPPLNPKFPQK